MSKRLAQLAVILPLLALLAVLLHGCWLRRAGGPLETQRALYGTLGGLPLCLGPAGRAPRAGPGAHPAIDARRHGPALPARSETR